MAEGEPLLVVEDTFDIKGRGLILVPHFDKASVKSGPVRVQLRLPDGSTRDCEGYVGPVFGSRIRPPPLVLTLRGVRKEEVPIGTMVLLR